MRITEPKGFKMDIFEGRVSEYAGRTCAERIPQTYAMGKSEYIKDRKDVIAEINHKISDLTKKLSMIQDKESSFYQDVVKRLKKCYEIKRNCEASIVLAKEQLKVAKIKNR